MFQLVTTVKTKTSQNTLHPVAAMLSDLPFVPVDVVWSWCPSYSEWTCMIIEHYSKNISCRKELLNLGVTAKSVINSWHFQWIKITWLIFWRNLSAHHQEKDADWSSEKTRACITFCSQRICFLCTQIFRAKKNEEICSALWYSCWPGKRLIFRQRRAQFSCGVTAEFGCWGWGQETTPGQSE